MAYGGGGIYPGPGFSSCLDDVPFKLGNKFQPPTKVSLPPGFDVGCGNKHSSALLADYSFEVEEAVLKWSAERERQQEEQKRLEEERQIQQNRTSSASESSENEAADLNTSQSQPANSEPLYENSPSAGEPVYENSEVLRPKPAPRVRIGQAHNPDYSNVTIPTNPVIANISNGILQPTQISAGENGGDKSTEIKVIADEFDMSMFDKVDDPFDNVELQTINVMQELASVLTETNKNNGKSESVSPNGAAGSTDPDESDISTLTDVQDSDTTLSEAPASVTVSDQNNLDNPLYENVQLKEPVPKPLNGHISPSLDLTHLPPVPARRNLVGQSTPLPPIGRQSVDSLLSASDQNQSNKCDTDNTVSKSVDLGENASSDSNKPPFPVSRSYPKPLKPPPPVPKPPRTFRYSRHDLEDGKPDETSVNTTGNASVQIQRTTTENATGFSAQYRNTHSTPDLHTHTQTESGTGLNFISTHFGDGVGAPARPQQVPRRSQSPPPRPSSGQSWNRYSPLPDPSAGIEQPTSVSLPAVPTRPSKPPSFYLSSEARASVDNLVTMGFPKESVVRAVSKLGNDEKEVVEYLCLVDQLKEKGYSSMLAETALILFQNNMQQASTYLELFTQLQELGFNGQKIQDALIETKNDREKTIDILTASS